MSISTVNCQCFFMAACSHQAHTIPATLETKSFHNPVAKSTQRRPLKGHFAAEARNAGSSLASTAAAASPAASSAKSVPPSSINCGGCVSARCSFARPQRHILIPNHAARHYPQKQLLLSNFQLASCGLTLVPKNNDKTYLTVKCVCVWNI